MLFIPLRLSYRGLKDRLGSLGSFLVLWKGRHLKSLMRRWLGFFVFSVWLWHSFSLVATKFLIRLTLNQSIWWWIISSRSGDFKIVELKLTRQTFQKLKKAQSLTICWVIILLKLWLCWWKFLDLSFWFTLDDHALLPLVKISLNYLIYLWF